MTAWIIGSATVATGLLSFGSSIYSSNKASAAADKANELAAANQAEQNRIANEALKDQRKETAKLDIQKAKYRAIEFKNPYEDMENVYEDLTVNQQQAEFQKDMFQQSQADIMQSMRGAAGASGIASLAQAMANQGQNAARQASISIGQQEQSNQMAKLQEEKSNDLAFRTGEASVEEREMNRQSTLLGMQMGQLSGANASVMQAQQNQMAANAAQANLYGQQAASFQSGANQMMAAGIGAVSSGISAYGAAKIPKINA